MPRIRTLPFFRHELRTRRPGSDLYTMPGSETLGSSSILPRMLPFRALSTPKKVQRRVAFHGTKPISRTTMDRWKTLASSSTSVALQRASALASSTFEHVEARMRAIQGPGPAAWKPRMRLSRPRWKSVSHLVLRSIFARHAR